jgi:hypothetical protein
MVQALVHGSGFLGGTSPQATNPFQPSATKAACTSTPVEAMGGVLATPYNPGLLRLELISDTLSISGNGAINIYSQALLQGQPVFRVDSLSAVYFRGTTIIADSVQALVHGSGFLGQWEGLLTSADSTQGAVLNVQGSGFGLGGGARLAGRLLNRGRLYTPRGQNATIAGQLINYGTVEVFSNTNWYFASGGSYTNYGSTTINPTDVCLVVRLLKRPTPFNHPQPRPPARQRQ